MTEDRKFMFAGCTITQLNKNFRESLCEFDDGLEGKYENVDSLILDLADNLELATRIIAYLLNELKEKEEQNG